MFGVIRWKEKQGLLVKNWPFMEWLVVYYTSHTREGRNHFVTPQGSHVRVVAHRDQRELRARPGLLIIDFKN
jgi:hypothetical protein